MVKRKKNSKLKQKLLDQVRLRRRIETVNEVSYHKVVTITFIITEYIISHVFSIDKHNNTKHS